MLLVSRGAAMPETARLPRRTAERLLELGASRLTDSELLAVLLAAGARRDAETLAGELLRECGGLHALLRRGPRELRGAPGLGSARIARLHAALELGRRYLEGPVDRRRVLKKPADAAQCFRARIADLSYEAFTCLFLDTRHRIICFELLFRGTVDGATVYPREVVKRALYHNAAAVVLGHNHPSGNCEPSEADRGITVKLASALALVDVRLLDHLVVSHHGHVSLAERGWI
jgi:DNA repair protein RadC